ncbi:MAG: hypothetical protein AAF985_13430 [Bacteroidota bacterium]
MNNTIFTNALRFIGLLFLQVFVLKNITFAGAYVSVMLYPVFILLLPIRIPHALLVLLGFVMGISLDIFYDSLGVHASASVLTAFIRPFVLAALEPRGGYGVNHSPTKFRFGFNFFFSYSCILMFAHLLVYFSMEIFTPVYLGEIFLRTVFSFLVSMIFVIIYQFLLNPRD